MDQLLLLVICIATVAALLHLWFGTDVLEQYARLTALGRWMLRIRAYDAWKEEARGKDEARRAVAAAALAASAPRKTQQLHEHAPRRATSYLAWLGTGGGFRAKLLTCPLCLGVWMALGVCVAAGRWEWTLAVYWLGLTAWNWASSSSRR